MDIKNKILRRLSSAALEEFLKPAELVHIDVKETIIEPNEPIDFVDFVESGMYSMLAVSKNEQVEVATVGPEGMTGVPLLLGNQTTITRTFCQVEATAYRVSAAHFAQSIEEQPELFQACQKYAFSLFEQLSKNSACNRLHSVEQRCAKWLLLTRDRLSSDSFELTQEYLAQMLGVRRASVNLAASTLQQAGLIRYTRGHINILKPEDLERMSCDCYTVLRSSVQSLVEA